MTARDFVGIGVALGLLARVVALPSDVQSQMKAARIGMLRSADDPSRGNRRTTKQFGISVSPELILRADRVIE